MLVSMANALFNVNSKLFYKASKCVRRLFNLISDHDCKRVHGHIIALHFFLKNQPLNDIYRDD